MIQSIVCMSMQVFMRNVTSSSGQNLNKNISLIQTKVRYSKKKIGLLAYIKSCLIVSPGSFRSNLAHLFLQG